MGYDNKKAFDKLPEMGYSEQAARSIWLWYHPSKTKKAKSRKRFKQ